MLSKVFKEIPHTVLLDKLELYRIRRQHWPLWRAWNKEPKKFFSAASFLPKESESQSPTRFNNEIFCSAYCGKNFKDLSQLLQESASFKPRAVMFRRLFNSLVGHFEKGFSDIQTNSWWKYLLYHAFFLCAVDSPYLGISS